LIQAVIFDFGNVICSLDNNIFLKKISHFTNKPVSRLKQLIYGEPDLLNKYETGLIDSRQFYLDIVGLCGLSMNMEEFRTAYTGIFTPISGTYDVIKKLKSSYKLGLLSNTSHWDFQLGIRPTEVFQCFDTVTLSYEVKAMKPSARIFQDALEKLELEPGDCVYIDDIQENVTAASRLGFKAFRYTNHTGLLKALAAEGVQLPGDSF